MTTAFAAVVGAMVSVLQTAPSASAQIHRCRLRPMSQDWTTAVVVRPLGTEVQDATGQSVCGIWTTAVAVECYARAAAGVSADLAVDALLQSVANRLLSNRTLGGLVGDTALGAIAYDFDADAETTACATLTFQIRHATAANSVNSL